MGTILESAYADLSEGVRKWRVWVALASEDIGDQHRRTSLGPMWLLVNFVVYVATFLVIFGYRRNIPDYAEYISTGLLVWLYMSEVISQATTLFVKEESFITGTRLPLTVYVLRLTMQSIIRGSYALLACLVILYFAGADLGWGWSWAILGVALIIVTTPAIVIAFAMLGAYFPDAQFIVSNLMRVGLFMTPIIWTQPVGIREIVYTWNPFTYYLALVRHPVMENTVDLYALAVCTIGGLLSWAVAICLLGALRKRVVFVL